MKENRILVVLLLFVTSVFAQVKGKVVDENNQPIPYVNIWVEGQNKSTTSDIDGGFQINVSQNETLLFSVLGFEKKRIKASEAQFVKLIPTTYELGEVTVLNKKETKQLFIGKNENSLHQAFENGPKFEAKFFPYKPEYKKTRYLKKVSIFTENALESAQVKIHFYENDNGMPGNEMLQKDLIVSVKKGSMKSWFDISQYNLAMPKNGMFIAIERLFIESNKQEKTVITTTGESKIVRTYYPLPFYGFVERKFTYTFLGGKWIAESKKDEKGNVLQNRVFEPAIQLILTN